MLGWRHDWFPAFYTRSSGLPVPHRVESAAEVAAVLANRSAPDVGVLLTVPIPQAAELDPAAIEPPSPPRWPTPPTPSVTGPAVTPYVLERIAAAPPAAACRPTSRWPSTMPAVAGAVAVAISALASLDSG